MALGEKMGEEKVLTPKLWHFLKERLSPEEVVLLAPFVEALRRRLGVEGARRAVYGLALGLISPDSLRGANSPVSAKLLITDGPTGLKMVYQAQLRSGEDGIWYRPVVFLDAMDEDGEGGER